MFNPQKHPVTASQRTPLPILLYLFWWYMVSVGCDSYDSCDKAMIAMGWKRHNGHNGHNVEPLENYTIAQRRFKAVLGPWVLGIVRGVESVSQPVGLVSVGGFGR